MREIFICIGLSLGLLFSVHSQELKFETSSHNFGEVKEDQGSVSHSFSFVNNLEAPIRILEVEASCGCTTPRWTKEVVQPGDSGSVTAEFDPYNKPGKFNKSMSISYDYKGQTRKSTLFIEGLVKPKKQTIEEELPTKLGGLRVVYGVFNLGRITDDALVVSKLDVFNDSDSVIFWKDSITGPKHIQVAFEPDTLVSGALGEIVLTYDPKLKDDLGFVSDNILLYTNEEEEAVKSFNVIATIQEYFPERTAEELAKAPRLTFDRVQHNFGHVNEGNRVVTEFTLSNTGKEELTIRKTKPNCGCTVSIPEKNVIQPGESIKLEVSFNTQGRRGRQYKTVTVFSNDPTAPSQMISIKADVQ